MQPCPFCHACAQVRSTRSTSTRRSGPPSFFDTLTGRPRRCFGLFECCLRMHMFLLDLRTHICAMFCALRWRRLRPPVVRRGVCLDGRVTGGYGHVSAVCSSYVDCGCVVDVTQVLVHHIPCFTLLRSGPGRRRGSITCPRNVLDFLA